MLTLLNRQATFLILATQSLNVFCWSAANESKVLQLFGEYAGSVRITGLRWSNPFYTKKMVSLRVRNFETNKLKVNDKSGNPIEIAAALQVWADDEL